MKNPSNIAHPLKNMTGTSQRNRVMNALGVDSALIDGKTMADRLFLISEYARQVNFYQYKKTEIEGESQELDSWSIFFKDSLPFQLAILSKTSIDELDAQFLLLYEELKANPSKQSLESLFNFIFNKVISPITQLFRRVENEDNSFTDSLLAIIKTSFSEAVKSYISLYNSSANFLCINKKNFSDFMNAPWQLKVDEIYALDLCIKYVQNGKKEAFLKAGDILNTIFRQVLSGMQDIVIVSPNYIDESLLPLKESLQKKHQPHIALIFTFLEVFKHFQGNINELSKEHLDFFYEKVLKLVSKNAIPDQAHIVFELANHKKQYVLKKDLLLKDGKDGNNQDIQFGLDHEIVIDKAQVKELRTLSLYPIKAYDTKYIEGVYIAPKANSADGIDKEFKEDQPANWPTLGDKYSKYIKEGKKEDEENLKITKGSKCKDGAKDKPEEHPKARLGFALSSPVLLLEEGKRIINIKLDCKSIDQNVFPIIDIQQKLASISETKTVYNLSDHIINDFSAHIDLEPDEEISEIARKHLNNFFKVSKNKIYKDDPAFNSNLDDLLSIDYPDPDNDPNTDNTPPVFENAIKNKVRALLASLEVEVQVIRGIEEPIFNLSFSGEKEWLVPNPESVIITTPPLSADNKMSLEITVVLESDFPAIVFYNKEALKETIDLKEIFPLVKIELNDEKISCITEPGDNNGCCLKKKISNDRLVDVSTYHFLQKLILEDVNIAVEVCGVKNVIVQNDDNLQDVNKTMFPFGPRPKEDASFIIGSKEVFCKNWQSFRIGVEWKDRPKDFEEYYEAYDQEDGIAIKDESFKMKASILDDAEWEEDNNGEREIFPAFPTFSSFTPCPPINSAFNFNGYVWDRADFAINTYLAKSMPIGPLSPLTVDSRKAFFRIRLKGKDFQHDSYAFVLAKQMMALANILDPQSIETIKKEIGNAAILCNQTEFRIDGIKIWPGTLDELIEEVAKIPLLAPPPFPPLPKPIPDNLTEADDLSPWGLEKVAESLCKRVHDIKKIFDENDADDAKLPNEPYTPQIKSIFVDYKAKAEINDIDIIHLYPFKDTSKYEDIVAQPTLFPYFDDEGTLFVGLEKITVGGSLSILFQLAEATADSELNRAEINWCYLSRNEWKPLEYEFKVISDTTDGFTVSGITTIIIPEDINNDGNTVMPDPLYWIKATTPENVKAVAETIGIHTQAAKTSARFTELNDKNRLEKALEEGSIAKLVEADFNVKKIEQLYPSFGGRTPEANGHFYTRVSEHLRHKGRTLMLNDYEKIVLEGFPEIYKAKCITHTMGLSAIDYRRDLEVAPGYVVVTVIPDLTKLKSGNLQEPKVPVSLLEKIGDYIRKRTSPFARLKVMNPRFESVDVSIIIRLYRGKSPDFYKTKLKEDITFFLAPWSLGDSEKLAFGQVVLFSDIVGFVEQLDYVDFVVCLDLEGECDQKGSIIKPLTARSVLTAGEICVTIDREKCNDDEQECPDDESTSNPDINKLYQSM